MAHHAHKHYDNIKRHFNFIAYVHSLQRAGVSPEAAEIQGEVLESMAQQISNQSLLTKSDLQETNIRIDEGLKATNIKIDQGLRDTNLRIDEGLKATNIKIDQGLRDTNLRIDDVKQGLKETNTKIKETNLKIERLQKDVTDIQKEIISMLCEIQLINKNMKLEIREWTNSTLLWIFSMFIVCTSGMLGVMAKGFHWI